MASDRSWLETGHYYPLLPRHRVFLYAPARGGDLFAKRFLDVWRRIPLLDRRTLLRHWKQRPDDPVTGSAIVAVMVVTAWGAKDPGTVAQCREYGHKLYFDEDHFDLIPEHICYYIAHELAHATWIARGESAHLKAAADICPDIDRQHDDLGNECERLANALVEEWGFSMKNQREP
jgi:hypothetical protein